jgi:hypothetical protein
VSWLHEAATWLIYALAAAMMLTMITAAILAGLVLRLAAEFLRELGDGRQEDDARRAKDSPSTSGE